MRAVVVLPLLLLTGGCALPGLTGGRGPTGSAEVIEAPAAEVWQWLAEAYADLGLPVTNVDSARLTLASTRSISLWKPHVGPADEPHARCTLPALNRMLGALLRPSARLDAVPVSAPLAWIMLTIESVAVPDGENTRLTTRVILSPISGYKSPGGNQTYCVSTGRLEGRIAETLRARAEPAGTPPA